MVTTGPGVTQAGSGQPVIVDLPIKNNGTVSASNVQITSANLQTAARLTPTSFPVSLGILAPGRSGIFQVSFDGRFLLLDTPYLLSVSGTYEVSGQTAGFTVNRFIAISRANAQPVPPAALPTP